MIERKNIARSDKNGRAGDRRRIGKVFRRRHRFGGLRAAGNIDFPSAQNAALTAMAKQTR